MRTFDEIFDAVISSWPNEIDLADAGVPRPDAEGHLFPQLSEAWRIALHRHAMRRSRAGETTVRPREIPKAEYEAKYWADLHTSTWTTLLAEYQRR